jgi:3'(2'), 5'-bisphosphate nucleotidase
MAFERELAIALDAARQAGGWLMTEYRRFQAIPDAPANITTEADHKTQETILTVLRRHFPQDAYCAEEKTPTLAMLSRSGPRLWVIDPIDGTRGFARKNGEFSVMIGFVHEGVVTLGVVYEPAHDRFTYARRGGKCWKQNGAGQTACPCRVTTTRALAEATLTQSHSRKPDVPSPPAAALKPKKVVETYSAGIKLALVARGEADLYVNTYRAFHDWDICAGHVLVEEAGGRITGLHGEELVYGTAAAEQRHGLLATNTTLHDESLARLRDLQPDE